MEIIFVLAVAMFIEKSCSQVLSISPTCYSNTKTLTFNCDTADHNQAVEFLLNGATKGSCIPGFGCANGITQSGTTTSLIVSFSDSVHNGSWTCKFGPSSTSPALTINDENPCPISQMNTSIATEGTTSINSIPEFSNITLPMISDSTLTTTEISASFPSYFNTGRTKMNAHTESTFFYFNTETTHLFTKTELTTIYTSTETTSLNANIETTNVYANTETTDIGASTETYEIETKTLGIVSNYLSTYQSMFATTAAYYTPGSFDTTSQIMTEPFVPPAYSISSYNHNEITVPTVFITSNFVPQTISETSVASDFPKYSIFSMTLSPSFIGNSFIAPLSTSLSVASSMTDTPASVFEISNVSRVNGFSLKSSLLTKYTFLFTNHSSIQISTVLPDFGTTWFATTINYNSKAISSMITPSSQQTNSDNSYNELGTSSKNLSSFIHSLSESVTSRELLMTYEVIELINTLSTSTIQSGLSEKNKNIIFITTTSAVITIIVVILLMIFAKLYMSKYNLKPPKACKEGDNISWSNYSIPPKAAFPGYSVTGKRIYPLLNTSSTSFKMQTYEHNWDDLV